MIIIPSDELHFSTLINKNYRDVVVDFYAGWCEPCKWLDKILLSIENKLPGDTVIVKVDVEKFTEIEKKYEIKSVPVLAIFRSGELLWRMNGFLNEDDLIKKIEEVLLKK